MTADQLRRVLRALIYVAVVVVPLVFWRGVTSAYDLTKATIFVALALGLVVALAWLAVLEPRRIAPRSILITTGLFAAAVLVVTVTSIDPIGSIIGQPGRFTGLPVVVGCLVVMLTISAAFEPTSLTTLGRLMTPVVAVIGGYAFLQHVGADPFRWSTASFGSGAFSTVGNPNTAAGVTAIALPFVLWAMLDDRLTRVLRLGAAVVAGLAAGALVAFASFQGPVAAVVSIVYLLAWAFTNGRYLGVWLIGIAAALPIGLLVVLPRRLATAAFIAFVLYYLALALAIPWLERRHAPEWLRARRWWVVGAVGVVAVAAVVVAGPSVARSVADQLADGLNERSAFYRAALASFTERPITGDGFETFVLTFTENRPAWHAERLEGSRTGSVHSIWLAMFQSGGLVLGAAYVALMATIVVWWGRGLLRQPLAGGGLLLAAGASLIASMVQGLVSIEHVALYLVHFTTAGMVVAIAWSTSPLPSTAPTARSRGRAGRTESAGDDATRTGRRSSQQPPRRRRPAKRRAPAVAVAGSFVVALVITAVVVVRPLRAEMAERRALRAGTAQDFPVAVEEISEAISLAPWVGRLWDTRASLNAFIGDSAAAAADAEQQLQRGHGSVLNLPVVQYLIDDAEALIVRGDIAGAEERLTAARQWALVMQENDPLARGVANRAATMLVQIAAGFEQIGDTAAAEQALDDALRLDPAVDLTGTDDEPTP